MDTIGLIAAMSQESNALLRSIKRWKPILIGSYRGYDFKIAGQIYTLVTSGRGARRAGEAARTLSEVKSPRMLISFGIAGAVEAELNIGDVVLPNAFSQLEKGVLGPIQPLEPWPDSMREAAAQALAARGAKLWIGAAITTSGSQALEYKLNEMRHPVLEMETAGIAQVAAEKGMPLFSLRAISDGPSAPITVDLGEVMDEDAKLRVGKLVQAILRNPWILIQSGQIGRNIRTAADNAALALVAALSQADFSRS